MSDSPTTAEICGTVLLEQPLMAAADPTDQQNVDLLLALQTFARRTIRDDFSSLTAFVELYPENPWAPAVETQLGQEFYRTGRYSRAIGCWKHVWQSNTSAGEEVATSISNQAGSQLAMMYARLGRMSELRSLLSELQKSSNRGKLNRELRGASEGLWSMEHQPEVSFRCGPLALDRICFATDRAKAGNQLIQDSRSTTNGFSAKQVAELSRRLGMNYQVAFRNPGAEIILPAVVHWKVGHYAALIARDGTLLRAEDPTFGKPKVWLSDTALDEEASGYFLVRSGPLPEGWRAVSDSEASRVWGKGQTNESDQDETLDNSTKTCRIPHADYARQQSVPMAQWNVNLLLASHHVEDTPVGYAPPVGPAVYIRASYDSINGWPLYGLPYSNVSQEWRLNWLAYLTDDPSNPSGDVRFAAVGGGALTFTDFNPTNQVFRNLFRNQAQLLRTGTNSYELLYPDGSKQIFDQTDGSIGTTRKVFMTAVVDASGNAATIQFDLPGRITSITDAIGQKTQFFYDLPTSNVVATLRWVPPYILTRVMDPFGRTAYFDCGGDGVNARLHSITDPINLTSTFIYEYSNGLPDLGMTNLITPYGTTVFKRGSYSGIYRANWVEITYPNGEKERVEYSEKTPAQIFSSEPLSIVPKGLPVRNFILWGRNTYYWDRKAYAQGYSPNDYRGARIYHWAHGVDYNTASGILESIKEPLEHRVWFNYEGQVNPTFVGTSDRPTRMARTLEDGTTQLSQFEYNSTGNTTKAVDPLGREFTLVYDTNEVDLIEIRQTRAGQNELLLSATYNSQHKLMTLTDAGRQTTTFTYNSRGQVLTSSNPRGEMTSYSYNTNGYLSAIDGPLPGTNDTTRFTYDAAGRLSNTIDPDGYTLTFDYDAIDRLTRITYPDGTYQGITYNRLDPEVLHDRGGRETRLTYNSIRQLVSVQDPLGRVTGFEWCGCGGLEAMIDPMGRTTRWIRDLQGRVSAKIYADGSQIQYSYDTATGWLKSIRDAKNQITTFDYNIDGSLRQKTYLNAVIATPPVQFAYDPNYPRLSQTQDADGTTIYGYYPITGSVSPGAGQLASIGRTGIGGSVAYQYDELGRLSSRSINGVTELRTLDPAGRTSRLTNALGAFDYTWEGTSRRLSGVQYPNGQHSLYTYLPNAGDHLLQSITHYLPNNSVLSQFGYDYTVIPQLTNWSQFQGGVLKTWASFYDIGDRLLDVTETVSIGAPHNYTFAYDSADNQISNQTDSSAQEFTCNALNQLIGSTSQSSPMSYAWDAANRLIAITNGAHITLFRYDAFDRRTRVIEQENSSIVSDRHYLWCGSELSEERDSTGTVLKRYFQRGLQSASSADLSVGTYFFTRDHLRSIREMTDSSGTVRAQYGYLPLGVRQSLTGDLSADFGFSGHYLHQPSGLLLARYRAYNPELGRWLSRDPLGEFDGANLYAYARDNPINLIDPLGLAGLGWGVGISAEADFIQPLTSEGGGAVGANLQYLSDGPDEGLALYTYTPGSANSFGLNIGIGLQLNVTWGNGGWTGLFDNLALGVNKFGAGFFQSPCADKTGEGWQGVSLGGGLGPLPGTLATYQTDYTKAPSIDQILEWVGNALGGGQHWGP